MRSLIIALVAGLASVAFGASKAEAHFFAAAFAPAFAQPAGEFQVLADGSPVFVPADPVSGLVPRVGAPFRGAFLDRGRFFRRGFFRHRAVFVGGRRFLVRGLR